MQFKLRSLLVAFAGFAIFLAVAQSAGYLVTAGVVVAAAMILWAWHSQLQGVLIFLRVCVGLLGIGAVWMLAVDWSVFVDECPDCRAGAFVDQYRVFGYPVHTVADHPTSIFEQALSDFERPCMHPDYDRWHKHRWWGLVWCRCPCWNGTLGVMFGPDDRYTQAISTRARGLARTRPDFADEMHQRIVEQHDLVYFWEAFMLDEMAKQAITHSEAFEAREWLAESSERKRVVGYRTSTKESVALINSIYEVGAKKVVLANFKQYDPLEPVFAESLFIKLPEEPEQRRQVILWAEKFNALEGEDPPRDFGQEYLHIWPL